MTTRPRIAFFDFPDVFEDFYPHYGIDQRMFGSSWAGTSNHAILRVLQDRVGDVRWYALALKAELDRPVRHALGFEVQILRSSALHRLMWQTYYGPRWSWRWRGAYRHYATPASYAAPLSRPLWRELRRRPPDVMFAQSYSSGRFDVLLVLARRLGAPLVAYHAGGSPAGYLAAPVRRRTLPHADLLIASSEAERDLLVDRFGVAPERVRVILTPIDTDAFRPIAREQACAVTGLDPARRRFLYVGRLSPEKGVGPLLEAFARAAGPDAELVIAGDGPLGPQLRARAAALAPARIRFVGWTSPERLANLYNAADCLVLASSREGFPAVVGEATACGTPVLASRVGGVSELVVDGESGWLFEPGDRAALEQRLSDSGALAAMRPRARRLAERRVSPAVVGEQLREAFEAIL